MASVSNVYHYTDGIRGYDSDAYHYGYVKYSVSEGNSAVTITLHQVGEYMTVNNDYYSSYSYYGTSTVSATVNGKTISGSNSSTRKCTSRATYYSFGGTAVSTSINRGTSASSVSLSLTWSWDGNTKTKSLSISIPKLDSFNITFQSNGSTHSTKTCYYGKSVSLPSNPSLTGYTFKEWNTASNGTGTKVTSSTTFTKATTVYAIFTKNSYTLTATSTGPIETTGTTLTGSITSGTAGWAGSGNTATKVIPYNDQYSTLPVVSATGHHATVWELTNGTDVSISTRMGAADTTIQPYWVRNTYTIIYDGNGNTGGSTANSSHTYNVSKALTTNGYTKTDYTFQGWATTQDKAAAEIVDYDDGDSVSNLTDSDGGEVTLYAVWKLNTRTLTLDANGGTINANSAWTGSGNTVTKTLTVGNKYGSLPWASLSRAGYIKKQNNSSSSGNPTNNTCWYTEKNGGNNVTSTTTIGSNNVTIYAQWTALTYTIKFYKNGGEGADINDITKTYEQSIQLPSKPSNWVKTGYTFKGWRYGDSATIYSGGSTLSIDLIIPQQNSSDNSVTLKAVWEPNTYTLTFNDGHPTSSSSYQGVTVPDPKMITYDAAYGSLPAPTVTTGEDDWGETHSFLGWYTDREGGSRRYDTDIVNTITNITLYAHWQLLGVKSNITDLRIYRSNENGNNDMTGQYATLDFTLLPGTNADGSTISKYNVTVKWKLSTATTYTTKTYTNVTNFNFHEVINTNILELKKYDVIITINDGVGTITKNQIISSGSLLLDGFKDSPGNYIQVALGGVADNKFYNIPINKQAIKLYGNVYTQYGITIGNPTIEDNLISIETNTLKYSIPANGTPSANNSFNYTDYISVEENNQYILKIYGVDNANIRVHGYDSNQNWQQQLIYFYSGTQQEVSFTIPSGISYVRISYPIAAQKTTKLLTDWNGDTQVNGDLYVRKGAIIGHLVNKDGFLQINGSEQVNGNLEIDGNINITSGHEYQINGQPLSFISTEIIRW